MTAPHVETRALRVEWGECAWTAPDLFRPRVTPRVLDELRDEEVAQLPIIYQDTAKTQLH